MARRAEPLVLSAVAALFVVLTLVILADDFRSGGKQLLMSATLIVPAAILVFSVLISIYRSRQGIIRDELKEEIEEEL